MQPEMETEQRPKITTAALRQNSKTWMAPLTSWKVIAARHGNSFVFGPLRIECTYCCTWISPPRA